MIVEEQQTDRRTASTVYLPSLIDMVDGQRSVLKPTAGSAAMDNGQEAASSSEEDVWDEQRIADALKVLKEMHIQVSVHDCLCLWPCRG